MTSNRDASAEYLRLALPLMAKYAIPVTPRNYALFYVYVSGANKKLNAAFDELVEAGKPVDIDAIEDLHYRYVAEFDEARFDAAREALRAIVSQLGDTMVSAGGEVSRYASKLDGYSDRLSQEVSAEELQALIGGLGEETRAVRDASSELHRRLEESNRETEALREELQKAREEAITDALTGLANRKAFDRALERLCEGSPEGTHCLLMADIDHFKRVNDTYGHLIGDKVIRFVGNTMKQSVKGKDLVARFGGEEYAVLLPETQIEGAQAVAETIRKAIESGRLVRADTREPIGTVTLSLGVAVYRAGESADELIGRADEALYHAKREGRNRVITEGHEVVATGTDG